MRHTSCFALMLLYSDGKNSIMKAEKKQSEMISIA